MSTETMNGAEMAEQAANQYGHKEASFLEKALAVCQDVAREKGEKVPKELTEKTALSLIRQAFGQRLYTQNHQKSERAKFALLKKALEEKGENIDDILAARKQAGEEAGE